MCVDVCTVLSIYCMYIRKDLQDTNTPVQLYMYSTSQKKLNGSNGTCNFGDGNVTLLQSSTSVTRELLDCNLKVT